MLIRGGNLVKIKRYCSLNFAAFLSTGNIQTIEKITASQTGFSFQISQSSRFVCVCVLELKQRK